MKRWFLLGALGLLLVGIVAVLSLAQDTDTETTAFTVTLNNTVRIDINATNSDDLTIDRAEPAGTGDLYYRYFEEDADGFAQVCLDIWAITAYQVSVTNVVSVVGGPSTSGTDYEITNALLEIQVAGFGAAPGAPCVAPGEPDDDGDNPTSDIPGAVFPGAGEDVSHNETQNLFTGGNTEGGTDNYVTAEIDFRLDLDAFEDNTLNAQYTFTLTFTVTET